MSYPRVSGDGRIWAERTQAAAYRSLPVPKVPLNLLLGTRSANRMLHIAPYARQQYNQHPLTGGS